MAVPKLNLPGPLKAGPRVPLLRPRPTPPHAGGVSSAPHPTLSNPRPGFWPKPTA